MGGRPVLVERIAEDGEAGAHGGEGQRRDAGWLAGGDADVGNAEVAVGEHLREESAEGVAHDDRLLRQGADDALVVVGDLREADPLEGRGVAADVGDAAVIDPGPAGHDHFVAAGPEVLGPRVPAGGGHPEPVDEDVGVLCWSLLFILISVVRLGGSGVCVWLC